MDMGFLLKQMLPPGFDMEKAMEQLRTIGAAIMNTDRRTVEQAEAVKDLKERLERIERTLTARAAE